MQDVLQSLRRIAPLQLGVSVAAWLSQFVVQVSVQPDSQVVLALAVHPLSQLT